MPPRQGFAMPWRTVALTALVREKRDEKFESGVRAHDEKRSFENVKGNDVTG